MSENVTELYAVQYASSIKLLSQQKGHKLAGAYDVGTYVGKMGVPVDQMGKVTARKVTGRFQPMDRVDVEFRRPWVYPSDYDLPQLIDSFDKLRLLTDPSSQYVTNATYAMGRAKDDELLAALFGPVKTGEAGTNTEIFPAAQVIAVNVGAAAATGLNAEKLIEAKSLLMANEVDLDAETLHCAITAKQNRDLLEEAKIVNKDYTDTPKLDGDGIIRNWLGISFHHIERVAADGNAYRRVPLWAQSGLHLGVWNDIETNVDVRKDLRGLPWQAYVKGTFGATRLEDVKVVEIKCAEG